MKTKVSLILALTAASSFVMGRSTVVSATLSQQTMADLSTAMHGEAFAYAKYLLYAQHARQGGNKDLAALFEETARVERLQHFAEEAQLAGLVGSDADNFGGRHQGRILRDHVSRFCPSGSGRPLRRNPSGRNGSS